jgi:hypothetical protein
MIEQAPTRFSIRDCRGPRLAASGLSQTQALAVTHQQAEVKRAGA